MDEEKKISLPLIILFVGLALVADLVKLAALALILLLGLGMILLIPAQLFCTAVWLTFQAYLWFKGFSGTASLISGILDEMEVPMALTLGVVATVIVVNNPTKSKSISQINAAAKAIGRGDVASGLKAMPGGEGPLGEIAGNEKEFGSEAAPPAAEESEAIEEDEEISGEGNEEEEEEESGEYGAGKKAEENDEEYIPPPARDTQRELIKRYFSDVVRAPEEERKEVRAPNLGARGGTKIKSPNSQSPGASQSITGKIKKIGRAAEKLAE